MNQRLWLVTALTLLAAGTASAQMGGISAHLNVGFAAKNDSYDVDGKRVDFLDNGGTDNFYVPINLGLTYDFFRGVYVGGDLGLLNVSHTDQSNKKSSSFGVRELDILVGWHGAPMVAELDAHLGFKIDLGKKPGDLSGTDIQTSDNQHVFHAGLSGMFPVMGYFDAGLRFEALVPIKRDISSNNTANEVQNGFAIDAGLVLAKDIEFGQLVLSLGLDLGIFWQGERADNGVVAKNTDSYLLSLAPFIGLGFGPHHIKLSLSMQDEDARTGIPLAGKNLEVSTVPVTIGYEFKM